MEVMHEGDLTRIVGVDGFSPDEYASSVHGSQARILETIGEPLSYDDLICYGSFAFRTAVSDRMCPSAAHPCCGYQCVEGSSRAIPWEMDHYVHMPWEEWQDDADAFQRKVFRAVADSVDRGIPVHYGGEEDGLIVGYSQGGSKWRCVHPYYKWGSEEFWHHEADGFAGGSWPWSVAVWREPKLPKALVPDRTLLKKALEQAVDMWSAGAVEDQYLTGDSAYGFWLQWLEGVDTGGVEDPKAGMQGNGWCFDVLIHSRSIAGRWIRWKADDCGSSAGRYLRTAGDRYEEMVALLSDGIQCAWSLALPPQKHDEWTPAMRIDQSGRLEGARRLDAEAVSAFRRALDSL